MLSTIGTHAHPPMLGSRGKAGRKGDASAGLPISRPFRLGLSQKLYFGRLTRGVRSNPGRRDSAGAGCEVLNGQTPCWLGMPKPKARVGREMISFLSCMHEKRRPEQKHEGNPVCWAGKPFACEWGLLKSIPVTVQYIACGTVTVDF